LGGRLVSRRRAADAGGDVAVAEAETVALVKGRWLIGKAGPVEGGVEEVAGAVAGEDAAGAVAAVRRGGQADDDHARPRIAEACDRLAPVIVMAEGAALGPRDLFAPGNQARAAVAANDGVVERLECGSRHATAQETGDGK